MHDLEKLINRFQAEQGWDLPVIAELLTKFLLEQKYTVLVDDFKTFLEEVVRENKLNKNEDE